MAVDQHAATARSILECPDNLTLWVEGDTCLLDEADPLGPHHWHGTPEFRCLPGSPLAEAARRRVPAVLRATSCLHPGEALTLFGKLRWVEEESCDCCGQTRARIALDPECLCLAHGPRSVLITPVSFSDPALQLNVGYLEHSRQHINRAHAEELRAAAAHRSGVPHEDVLGAQLVSLGAAGVELDWVTPDGAHREPIPFGRPARGVAEFGALLRHALRVSIC